jgi:hypothetical protein
MEIAHSALLWAGQRDSHESGPTLRGSNPDSWSLMTTLATPSHTIASPSTFVPGRKAASYNGYIRQKMGLSSRKKAPNIACFLASNDMQ